MLNSRPVIVIMPADNDTEEKLLLDFGQTKFIFKTEPF